MLTTKQVEDFKRDGFVNGGPCLDDETVDTLRAEVLRVIDDQDNQAVPQPVLLRNLADDTAHPVWQIVNIWEASPAFKALVHRPHIAGMAAQLLGAQQLRVWHDQIQYKPKTYGGLLHWHQDSPKWGVLQPKTSQITAWIALDDADQENGCMVMVPGSYRWGDQDDFLESMPYGSPLPATFEDQDVQVVSCPVQKGHVHFHHALTWHGSGTNTSQRPRRAIAIHYMSDETIFDATGGHVMKRFITTEDGMMVSGEQFPLVWSQNNSQ